jgi:hypothetical protein
MRAKACLTMFKKLIAKLTGKDEKKSDNVNAFKESETKKSE